MKLLPWNWGRGEKAARDEFGVEVATREVADGIGSGSFDRFISREVSPRLYEAVREAVPPIDGAINRMVTLDGIVRVEGMNDKLVNIISQWMQSVRVGDLHEGFQAFYALQGNELYEQGLCIGGYEYDERGRDVVRLAVADSKGVFFRRNESGQIECWYRPPKQENYPRRDGTENLERVLRGTWLRDPSPSNLKGAGFVRLDLSRISYAAFFPEADSPYGTSIMRSTEFDAHVLLTMKNALRQVWNRFGDPIFRVTYQPATSIPQEELEKRKKKIAETLAHALKVKRAGNSADVVFGIGKNDQLQIDVLGANGQALEIEAPARHILEQIVAKTGLPSWMLGFHWSTAERLAERQGEIALQESRTRFAQRLPGLERIVKAMLRARGLTWRDDVIRLQDGALVRGDWRLVQELPNLQDLVAKAQAGFLDAQREMMLRGRTFQPAVTTQSGKVTMPGDAGHPGIVTKATHTHEHKEQYVEDARNLLAIERRIHRALSSAWDDLYEKTLKAIGLGDYAKASEPTWVFDTNTMQAVLNELRDAFVESMAGEDESAVVQGLYDAWERGIINAAEELAISAVIGDDLRRRTLEAIRRSALEQIRNTTARIYRDDIVAELAAGILDGQHPRDVARHLRDRFDVHDVDWERLAISEVAAAQSQGKVDKYLDEGVSQYEIVNGGGACPLCTDLAASGPYAVGAGPLPSRDTHPRCRCTVVAVVE